MKSVLALLELPLAPLEGVEPLAEIGFGGVDTPLALGEPAIVGLQALLPRFELLGPAPKLLVVLPKLALARGDRRFAPSEVSLGQQTPVLRLLDALDALVELAGVLLCRRKLVPGLGANLSEHRFGTVELANEMVDSRLPDDVLGAELGQPALAMLYLGFLYLSLLRAIAEVGLPPLQVAIDSVKLRATLVEHVDGTAEDMPLDAATKSLAEAGVGVGHAAL